MTSQTQNPQTSEGATSFIVYNSIAQLITLLAMSPYLLGFVRARTLPLDFVLYFFIACLLTGSFFLIQLSAATIIEKLFGGKARRRFVLTSATVVWFFLILDVAIVSKFGLHLDNRVVLSAFSVRGMNFGISLDAISFVSIVLTIATVFAMQLGLFHFFQDRPLSDSFHRFLSSAFKPLRVFLYCMGLAILLGVFEVAADSGTVPSSALPIYASFVQRFSSYPNLRLGRVWRTRLGRTRQYPL